MSGNHGNHLAGSVAFMFHASCSKRMFMGLDGRPYRWDVLYDVVVVSTDDVKVVFAVNHSCSCPRTMGQKRRS